MGLLCSVNVGGTATGATCISYVNCNTTCCTKTYTGCTGTPSVSCGGAPPCSPIGCCYVDQNKCKNLACSAITEASCVTCGCTKVGTCTTKSCASLATTNLLLCAGCGNCSGTATLSGTVDLRSYWSITTRIFSTTAVADNITMDATHILGFNSAI